MSHLDPAVIKHKQDVRRYILLPIVASMTLIAATVLAIGVLTAMGSLTPRQVSTMASTLAIVCVLIPLGLVVILFSFGMMVIAFGSGRLPAGVAVLLRPIRRLIQTTNSLLQRVANVAAEPVIFVERYLARIGTFVDGLLHLFSDRDQESDSESDTESTI